MDSQQQKGKSLIQPPQLREASFEDHGRIVLLESQYGLQSKSYEEWKHLWTGNPAYIQLGKQRPIGWVECRMVAAHVCPGVAAL
jgi:hypothetical protein